MADDPAADLRRAIRQSEERVAEGGGLVEALERDGDVLAAPRGRALLAALRQRLDHARARLVAQRRLFDLAEIFAGSAIGPDKARGQPPPAANRSPSSTAT